MTDRERLIELLEDTSHEWESDVSVQTLTEIAEHLIENGVIVLPCKVGDTVYELTTSEEIEQRKVKDIIYDNEGFRLRLEPYFSYEYYLNETVFLTHSEAAQALKERISNHRK